MSGENEPVRQSGHPIHLIYSRSRSMVTPFVGGSAAPSRSTWHWGHRVGRPRQRLMGRVMVNMSLFSRLAKVTLAFVLLSLFASTHGTWTSHGGGQLLSVSTAWAGSPDETLNPPPTPPKSKYSGVTVQPYSATVTSTPAHVTRTEAASGLRWTDRLAFVWRFYLASVLRI